MNTLSVTQIKQFCFYNDKQSDNQIKPNRRKEYLNDTLTIALNHIITDEINKITLVATQKLLTQ